MVVSNQLSVGMVIKIEEELYRVVSMLKVSPPKGASFIKAKLKTLREEKEIERSFKLTQVLEEVSLEDRSLEFLYVEGSHYLFLDIGNLERRLVPPEVVGRLSSYLKEGVRVKAMLYEDCVFSIELPPFLELRVQRIENDQEESVDGAGMKLAILETGAQIEVPPFIVPGDVITVDTQNEEYIQRV